jgi:hypothetical protein
VILIFSQVLELVTSLIVHCFDEVEVEASKAAFYFFGLDRRRRPRRVLPRCATGEMRNRTISTAPLFTPVPEIRCERAAKICYGETVYGTEPKAITTTASWSIDGRKGV